MKRFLKIISVGFLSIMILIQFIPRPQKNKSDKLSETDISKIYPVSDSVLSILKSSCYDCHSNHTEYPWYASVQPLSIWMNHHIEEGKKELNFSEFGNYSKEKQTEKLEEIDEVIKRDIMPLGAYKLMHSESKLNQYQKAVVSNWIHLFKRKENDTK